MLDQAIAQMDQDPEGSITTAQVVDMLGLADREAVFELMDAVMAGKPAAALAITDRAYERGADLGALLQDLLDLLHTITRLKSIPALRQSQELPEAERTRGAEFADRLTVPVLARAWQMLLKGVGEVEIAPDRRAAAEMVLIRLCHVSDLPTPGDLIRRLTSNPPPSTPPGTPIDAPNGGGVRAVANGAPIMSAEPAPQAGPRLRTFREVVAFVADQKEAMLHAHLLHSVHLVRFVPPVIELRPQPEAPRDLASRLAALLTEATGTRWTIAMSAVAGEPTIAEQGDAADMARKTAAADHPLVQAILAAFPGARIDTVHDKTADAYGLPTSLPSAPHLEFPDAAAPDMPDFAPPDAEYFDEDPMEIDL
jgi:DNA polymerase-3 subunit gamma/tau